MSYTLMAKVKNANVGDMRAKLVLWHLAEHAHNDGSCAYPSIARIARDVHMGRNVVKRALRYLRAAKFIKAWTGGNQHYSTCYSLNVRLLTEVQFPKFKSSAGRPNNGARDPEDFPGTWDDPTPSERRVDALAAARRGERR
jgi:hypothetical protein